MRFSSTFLLALPATSLAQEQIPLLDKLKGFFNKASAAVSSAIPAAPEASLKAATEKTTAKAASAILHPLTFDNWRQVLTVDAKVSTSTTQDWLVFVTGGNNTCFGLCGNATKAWNASLPVLAAKPNAPKFAYLDCEVENILCNAWSIGAPSLYYLQIPKPLPDQSAPVPTVRYKPLNRTSTTAETFKTLIVDNEIEKVEPYSGFFHPFTSPLWQYSVGQYSLAYVYGYVTYGFSKMPSWLPMILISFFSRSIMNKRLNPGAPAQAQAAARPAQ